LKNNLATNKIINMKKVTVTKVIKVGENPYFRVSVNGEGYKLFSFRFDEEPDSLYNEEMNRLAAMKLAKELENGNTNSEEIIYESK